MDLPFSLGEPRALLLLLLIVPVAYLGVLGGRARARDRARIYTSVALRSIIMLLITLALAGLQWVSYGGPLNVVYLIDESASVTQDSHDAAYSYVRSALEALGPSDRAGVVLFGERAIVDRAISGDREWQSFGKHPQGIATDLAGAIQTGTALFPEGGSRRLVLLTDGVETAGAARDVAARVHATGIELSVVPLGVESQNEVAVLRLASPGSVPKGQQYEVRALVKSTSQRDAEITLSDGAQTIVTRSVQLPVGETVVSFEVPARDEGFRVLSAKVISADDRYSENNVARSFTVVRTPPAVLIVAEAQEDAGPLKAALEASGMSVSVTEAAGLPSRADALAEFDTVVLANVSADALGLDHQQVLQSYVREYGKGLIMVGGEVGYGAGGYMRSVLEEVLPVTMDVRTTEQRASIAMTFLIDKSGSMGRCHCGGATTYNPGMRTEFGPSKVEIAKNAVARAASLLNSTDQVGVVGFDSAAHTLIPLTDMGELGATGVQRDLKPVSAEGGPTSLHAGIEGAIAQLGSSAATLKHIILISDGWFQQGDFSAQTAELARRNITLTAIGAGEGPGDVLSKLAEAGGGRYYTATNIYSLPDVLLKETVRLAGSYYVEQSFRPVVARSSPILNGLPPREFPTLLGYDAATAKPEANVILKSPDGDPVLAEWQYGLGKSIAWTPDMKGRWGAGWVEWPLFSRFAGQLVSWTIPQAGSSGIAFSYSLAPSLEGTGQDVSITINSTDSRGAGRNGLESSLVLTSTDGLERMEAPVRQNSPGVYAAALPDLHEGVYEAYIEQRSADTHEMVARERTGLVVPYPSEFAPSEETPQMASAFLGELAQLGGGKVLSIAEPRVSLVHDAAAQPIRVALAPWLLLAAILLFPLDVATRRLSISLGDFVRMLRSRGSKA